MSGLRKGDIAPEFKAEATESAEVSLSEELRSSQVLLAFYPKAFTGG